MLVADPPCLSDVLEFLSLSLEATKWVWIMPSTGFRKYFCLGWLPPGLTIDFRFRFDGGGASHGQLFGLSKSGDVVGEDLRQR